MQRLSWVVVVILAVFSFVMYSKWKSAETRAYIAEAAVGDEVVLLEGLRAKIAADIRPPDSTIGRLWEAEKKLNGKLVAAVAILQEEAKHGRHWDTVYTDLSPDSTRTATVIDTTPKGVLNAKLTAPPCCAPLGFSYTFTTPPRQFNIGFVQRGDSVYAVGDVEGDPFTIGTSYYKPRVPFLDPAWLVDARVSPKVGRLFLGGSALVRGKLDLYGGLETTIKRDTVTALPMLGGRMRF